MTSSVRVLGVDPGTVRVGLALSDPDGRVATPRRTLEPRGSEDAVRLVAEVVREEEVACVVVGLPLRLDGGESTASRRARRFADQVREACGVPVELWDERLTTAAAQRALREAGVGGRRGRQVVDRVAATVLLQSYLDARGDASREAPWPGDDDPSNDASR